MIFLLIDLFLVLCFNRFPTLYFAPMNSKGEPKKYQGGRDVDSFVEYLKRESTNSFELPTTDKKKKKKKSKEEKDEL